jgi:beta-N-acetylhexosaminidase
MAHGWSEDEPLSREPDGQGTQGVTSLRAKGSRTLRINSQRARRLYPATLLVVVSCLLALLACDLSPSFLPLLVNHSKGAESAPPAGQQTATPGHFAPSKPFSLADLEAQTVDYYLSHMTLDEKVGQMMMFETTAQSWNNDMDAMVRQMHAGAIIIYKKNMVNPKQLTTFISSAQAHTKIPMFVTMDEEGGNVDRLGDMGFNKPLPSASWLGGTGNPQLAYKAGVQAARNLQSYGINTDLAPVVDVRVTPGQIEGPRLYGNDPSTVESYATQFLQGLQQNNIIGCLKHWPGIGDANQDPHLTLPTIDRTRDQLEATEFAPFRMMLKDNPGMIMVTHVILKAIDPTMPSSLSPAVVDGVLRGELGYDGVVITDNLWMKGISDKYSLGQAAVLAIIAGDDLLEGAWAPYELRVMISAVKNAIASGQISVSRINQSVRRLLTLKVKYGILPYHLDNRPHLPAGIQASISASAGMADLPRRAATLG